MSAQQNTQATHKEKHILVLRCLGTQAATAAVTTANPGLQAISSGKSY